MIPDKKIRSSDELEFAVFCIESVAARLGVSADRVYQTFTEKSHILNGYIVPEYDVMNTQSREYIVDDLLILGNAVAKPFPLYLEVIFYPPVELGVLLR